MKRVLLACFIPFVACLCSAVLAAEAPIQNLKSKAESARPAKQIQNPNLLILLTDDQRWDAMGCAGNRIVRTPEMDRLAREGTLFVNAFVTSSICAASRASIFMGQYERAHRCNFNTGVLNRAQLEQSYPMLLRRAGYHTGFIGKYGVGDGKREIEGAEVFDRWFGFYGQGLYFPKTHPGKHLNAVMVEQARDFLDRAPAGKPWCLSISFKAPHSGKGYLSYESEPDLKQLYADVTIPMPPTAKQEYFDALPEFLRRCNARTSYWEQRFSTPEQYQSVMRDYYRLITGADRAIGRIRAELTQRGLADNTVILFLSDNGDMMGDYMLGGKELLHDASIRVPLIVHDPRAPSSARGQRRKELALNIDIAPTALDFAGASVPAAMQGRSLAPLVRGERVAWRKDFFCENNFCVPTQYYPMIEGVRTTRWKYIRYTDVQPVYEQLFDLDKDANEVNDLARAKKHASTLADLRRRCDELCGEVGQILLSGPASAAQTGVSAPRPNILLIITDDQGYGDLSIHGNPHLQTPHIDRLGRSGVRFDRFYVNSFCSPTRAALLTGRWPLRTGCHGVTHNREAMRPAEVTLAEVLRGAGYRSACIGKWHNGEQHPFTPQGQGFDESFGFNNGHWNNYFDATLLRGAKPERTKGYITDVLTDEAIKFIAANRARPFFCYLAYNAPHSPYQVPDRYFDRFKAKGFEDNVAAFYGMCENLDDNVGRLLARLDELRLAENTIVLFLTDNGGTAGVKIYNAGMRGGKTSMHEGGTRVPLFVRWPAAKWPPHVARPIVSHIDLFPTLLDLCGVKPPAGPRLDGISLRPLLEKTDAPAWPERVLFTHNPIDETNKFPGAVRTQRHRLVREIKGPGGGSKAKANDASATAWQLYDMENDPGQEKNIAAAHPDIVERLGKLYDEWFADISRDGPRRFPLPVGHAKHNPVELHAPQAYFDKPLQFASGPGFANDWLTGWTDEKAKVWFEIEVAAAADYDVELAFACPPADAGSKIRLAIAGKSLEAVVPAAPAPDIPLPHRDAVGKERYRDREWGTLKLGTLRLRPGPARLTLEVLSKPGAVVMDLKHVKLLRH